MTLGVSLQPTSWSDGPSHGLLPLQAFSAPGSNTPPMSRLAPQLSQWRTRSLTLPDLASSSRRRWPLQEPPAPVCTPAIPWEVIQVAFRAGDHEAGGKGGDPGLAAVAAVAGATELTRRWWDPLESLRGGQQAALTHRADEPPREHVRGYTDSATTRLRGPEEPGDSQERLQPGFSDAISPRHPPFIYAGDHDRKFRKVHYGSRAALADNLGRAEAADLGRIRPRHGHEPPPDMPSRWTLTSVSISRSEPGATNAPRRSLSSCRSINQRSSGRGDPA